MPRRLRLNDAGDDEASTQQRMMRQRGRRAPTRGAWDGGEEEAYEPPELASTMELVQRSHMRRRRRRRVRPAGHTSAGDLQLDGTREDASTSIGRTEFDNAAEGEATTRRR